MLISELKKIPKSPVGSSHFLYPGLGPAIPGIIESKIPKSPVGGFGGRFK